MEDGKVESSVNQSKEGESLFPVTKEISKEDFDRLPRSCRFNFGDKESGYRFIEVDDGEVRVGMTSVVDARGLGLDEKYEISADGKTVSFPRKESLPSDQGEANKNLESQGQDNQESHETDGDNNPEPQEAGNLSDGQEEDGSQENQQGESGDSHKPLEMGITQDGLKVSYSESKPDGQEEEQQESQEVGSYCIDGLNPRKIEDQSEVARMTLEDLAKELIDLKGEQLVVYTGAGISMGGEKPVWGMGELQKQLGLEGSGQGKDFGEIFRNSPEILLGAAEEFADSLFADKSTEAHKAIAELVRREHRTWVMTENVDLKHEAEGSRLAATHTGGKEAFGQVILRAPGAKVVLVVGLSHDDRAILEYFKKINPEVEEEQNPKAEEGQNVEIKKGAKSRVKIVAIDIAATDDRGQEAIPEFLGQGDHLLKGDCQEILPALVEEMKKLEAEKHEMATNQGIPPLRSE